MTMRDADVRDVARFMDVPVASVNEQLDAMSPRLLDYMEILFSKYVEEQNA